MSKIEIVKFTFGVRTEHFDKNYHLSQRTTKPTIRLVTSKDSEQPAHPRRLIRVFADRIFLLKPIGYQTRDEREPLPYWVDIQVDLSLLVTQVYCRFCRALSHLDLK